MPDLFNQEREFEQQVRDMSKSLEAAMVAKTAKQAASEKRSAILGWAVTLIVIGLVFLTFVYLRGV
ncbi:hypothetical protein [Rhizobium sp. C4]|uniref:hypothetical protein n=1 Tax=Rhizobium sp. C4 TaxID=1349800 RepID=UPI001E5A75B6|nr:hypothetical protein [Rhizobium sp. C4]MCD2174610.1 hypothetical protein [Rhizobium sp. C4]